MEKWGINTKPTDNLNLNLTLIECRVISFMSVHAENGIRTLRSSVRNDDYKTNKPVSRPKMMIVQLTYSRMFYRDTAQEKRHRENSAKYRK